MAASDTCEGFPNWLVLQCMDPNLIGRSSESEISISTADISSWDLPSLLHHHLIKLHINPSTLIEHSTYFHSLLAGSFSESSMSSVSIHWNLEMFLHMLRFVHGCCLEFTFSSFLPLYRTALYFGVDRLVLECTTWFCDNMSKERLAAQQLHLDDLIRFWDFGLEHATCWIVEECTSYVARNFMWAVSCDTFVVLPYNFLITCLKHPHLTVYSERHLCEALLAWISANTEPTEQSSNTSGVWIDKLNQENVTKNGWANILKEVRVGLLPLWFTLGKYKCSYFSAFAKESITIISGLLKRWSRDSESAGDYNIKVRLTEFSKKLDLSGCLQITPSVLLRSILCRSSGVSPLALNDIGQTTFNLEFSKWISYVPTLSFKAMVEVDISKCFKLHPGVAMECFKKAFPSLKTLKMAYFLDFETKKLCQLLENSVVCEVDFSVDVSPLLFVNASVLFSESVSRSAQSRRFYTTSCHGTKPSLSNITKLTLEGRTDFSDSELSDIAERCDSLCYLNIRGCLSVTDAGIANLIIRCGKLHSIIASDTSFGRSSISALCSRALDTSYCPVVPVDEAHLKLPHINLEVLHAGSCKGVCEASLQEILSQGRTLKSLSLRDTCLGDRALCTFSGTSLEMLDVSDTMISGDALSQVILKNPGLKILKASGCRNLNIHWNKHNEECLSSLHPDGGLFGVMGRKYQLEELAIGWGFSDFTVSAHGPALRSLKAINVGLGGSLGPEGLSLLFVLCSLLESVSILFQVISDSVMMNLLALKNLEALSVGYCIGDLSPMSLKCVAPNLRKLKLARVTPWITNGDLALLARNCINIIELSLVGCAYLDVETQKVISSGWPGLISLRLEDCGAVTANGVGFLLDCEAMEDLLLRHNGPGIQRNFIIQAASKLPMLRSISLDWCDASEDDFNLPNFADKHSLSNVKISRCKLQKCSLDIRNAQNRPVHKETLVLVWNSTCLQRTVVKERIT